MRIWKGVVWAVARNTDWGRKQLGQETAQEEALRRRLEGRWYSKYREENGKIHLLIDPDGNPTNTYPHVHVIHDEQQREVRIVASTVNRRHVYDQTLSGEADGNEVNAAIDQALTELRRHA